MSIFYSFWIVFLVCMFIVVLSKPTKQAEPFQQCRSCDYYFGWFLCQIWLIISTSTTRNIVNLNVSISVLDCGYCKQALLSVTRLLQLLKMLKIIIPIENILRFEVAVVKCLRRCTIYPTWHSVKKVQFFPQETKFPTSIRIWRQLTLASLRMDSWWALYSLGSKTLLINLFYMSALFSRVLWQDTYKQNIERRLELFFDLIRSKSPIKPSVNKLCYKTLTHWVCHYLYDLSGI